MLASALQGLEAAADEGLPGGSQDLDGHVVGDPVFFDEAAQEVELRLGGAGEADLDLLEADLHQLLEHPQLPLYPHGQIPAAASRLRCVDARRSSAA